MTIGREQPQPEQFLEEYIHKLDIKWKVMSRVMKGIDGPSIISDKKTRIHDIQFPPEHLKKEYRSDFLHELTHAKLAEELDPIFSAISFDPSYRKDDPQFLKDSQLVYYAQLPVEVWISDFMASIDPIIAEEDITTTLIPAAQMSGQEYRSIPSLEIVFGYALNHAQLLRRNVFEAYSKFGREALQKIRRFIGADAVDISELYSSVLQ